MLGDLEEAVFKFFKFQRTVSFTLSSNHELLKDSMLSLASEESVTLSFSLILSGAHDAPGRVVTCTLGSKTTALHDNLLVPEVWID